MGKDDTLMSEHKDNFERAIEDLKYCLKLAGHDLKSIKVEPRLGKAARQLLRDKEIEIV